jgi:hypothetical protein
LLKAYTRPDKACIWQVGKYKDSAGLGACKSCDEWRGNTYTTGTGSTSTDDCTCNAGYFGKFSLACDCSSFFFCGESVRIAIMTQQLD